jgi:hypothetical protein
MVNLKKISAIATGALFIGSTIGMAAAVDVPSGVSDMLAKNGVAKAQLVVGANAPGQAADEASAKIIQDAVIAKLGTTVGGDITITYGSDDIDDDGVADTLVDSNNANVDEIDTDAETGNFVKSNTNLNVDGNGEANWTTPLTIRCTTASM